jgi:hypothetical protein
VVRIFARLRRADFRNSNLVDARLGTERNQFKMPKQTDLSGALFGGAMPTSRAQTRFSRIWRRPISATPSW